jgi:RecA-family ATPase
MPKGTAWVAAMTFDEELEEVRRGEQDKPVPSLTEWLERNIPSLDLILGAFIHTLCRVIITGPTGLGKTMLGLAMALRAAAGAPFLQWKAGRPCRVLYVDGEMPRGLMQDRLRSEVRRSGLKPDSLFVLSKEDFEAMPPLNTDAGQQWMDAKLDELEPELIFFDNIQALIVGDHTKEESWSPVLSWVRSLTKRHIGQIWFHHTGHNEGHSYGTSTRQWQMGVCILLERAAGAENDLTFTIKFTKARERTPQNRADFEDVTVALRNDQWESPRPALKAKAR